MQIRRSTLCALLLLCASISNAGGIALTNINGYTSSDDGLITFETMVIGDDGRILEIGDATLPEKYTAVERIDGQGRTVLPGITDAHAHLSSLGFLQDSLDVMGVASLEETVAQIAAFAKRHPARRWLTGRGWNQVIWPSNAFPTAADIDAVVSDRPVWLRRVDGHAAWANSKAMEIAEIDRDTPDPVGGKIIRDDNGDATGVLIDTAMALVESKLPPVTKDDIRRAYLAGIANVNSLGITGVHDAGIDIEEAEVLISLADDGELALRFYGMLGGAGRNLDEFGEPLIAYGNDRLDIRSVKLYQDGALGSRGAAMLKPYDDDPENTGLPFWDQEELNQKVQKANSRGFQVGVHAIGDRGNRMVLNAFSEVQAGKPSAMRNRVEHAQIISLDDIARFKTLGLIASMQPTHATSDMNMAEDRIGPDRIQGAYAWRKLLDQGTVIASGSDFPVELVNPFHGLYAAVTRRDRQGMPESGWYPEESLTRLEALHSFTMGAAYAAFQEERLGSLEAGKWADFIVVDRDYFAVPEDQIDDIEVLETWIAGEKVFDATADE